MMSISEQGVLFLNKLINLFTRILLITVSLSPLITTETLAADTYSSEEEKSSHHVYIISSTNSSHHTDIIQKIANNLKLKDDNISVSNITPEEKIEDINSKTDIIIGIGKNGMISAEKNYPKINKLFIATDPHKYRLDKNKNKHDSILYMIQPYCRQMGLIKYFNPNWKTISILNNQTKPVDTIFIQRCANKLDIKTYIVSTSVEDNLTNKLKHALTHSDVLLATPDSSIYNRKNIKNILLTSYRYRKPVIGFSKNFADAGAIASISSNTEQIAQSALKLIEQYFESDNQFTNQINYPVEFDININRQVCRALNIPVPDINILKGAIEQIETNKIGDSQ